MNREFGQAYIHNEFAEIDTHLPAPLNLYLIGGGGAMALQNLKDATKDIDAVVQSGHDLQRLQTTLESIDYKVVKELDEEYERLGASLILENDDGCRFDIFNRQVVSKLIYSSSMQARSQPLTRLDTLTVKIAAPEDIFLFKTVAGRTRDIADMNTLVQAGLDYETIIEEIEVQTTLLDEEFFVTFINESLGKLEDQFNVTTPLDQPVVTIAERVYEQLHILLNIEESITVDSMKKDVDLTEESLLEHLENLEAKGNIQWRRDQIQKIADRP